MALFKKKGVQEMIPYNERIDMTDISISVADRENGSPKIGDMIATADGLKL